MSVDDIRREAESIFQAYDAEFAGQPRASRDIAELDDLIERLESLLERARGKLNGGDNDELVTLIEQASENLEIYREEREAIRDVQEGDDAPLRASRLAMWANAEFHRYLRHFAGQNRATRDLALLEEMIEELVEIRDEMESLAERANVEGLAEDKQTVESNLEAYTEERERIREARSDGTPEEQASILAEAANAQFAIYDDLFAGRDRTTRRPELLERIIESLEDIRRQMESLRDEGSSLEENERNIGIVDDRLTTYRRELREVEEAKEGLGAEDHLLRLGGAANEIFETYQEDFAEHDRATRDLDQLGRMCDELYHLARQMDGVDEDEAAEKREQNLSVVLENMSLYQSEYDAIAETQGSGA